MACKVWLFCILVCLSSTVFCQRNELESGINDWLLCSNEVEFSQCLEERTIRKLHEINLVAKRDFTKTLVKIDRVGKKISTAGDEEIEKLETENKEIMEKIKSREKSENTLLDEITDLFTYGVVKILGFFSPKTLAEDDQQVDNADSRNSEEDEGRGHKKKYLKKQNKKLKIILLLMLFKHKVKMFVAKFQVLLQLKFLALTFANLMVNAIRLWWDFKKQYKPNKVVYYENAHHQHHYDHEHVHDHDDGHFSYPSSHSHHSHHEEEYGGGGPWPWSRSYIEKQSEQAFQALNGQRDKIAPPHHPQNIVYLKQRPTR